MPAWRRLFAFFKNTWAAGWSPLQCWVVEANFAISIPWKTVRRAPHHHGESRRFAVRALSIGCGPSS
jgi:hypothetical protein